MRSGLTEDDAYALFESAQSDLSQGRPAQALVHLDELEARLPTEPLPALPWLRADVLGLSAHCLEAMGRTEEAIERSHQLIAQFGSETDPDVVRSVAQTLSRNVSRLGVLGRYDEALEVGDEFAARYVRSSDPDVRTTAARVRYDQAIAALKAGRQDKLAEVMGALFMSFEDESDPATIAELVDAVFRLGFTLLYRDADVAAIAVFQGLRDLLGDDPATDGKTMALEAGLAVAMCQARGGDVKMAISHLSGLGTHGDLALAAARAFARRAEHSSPRQREDRTLWAALTIGIVLNVMGRRAEAASALDNVVAATGDSDEPFVDVTVAAARHARREISE